jgi:hypothetical protein
MQLDTCFPSLSQSFVPGLFLDLLVERNHDSSRLVGVKVKKCAGISFRVAGLRLDVGWALGSSGRLQSSVSIPRWPSFHLGLDTGI